MKILALAGTLGRSTLLHRLLVSSSILKPTAAFARTVPISSCVHPTLPLVTFHRCAHTDRNAYHLSRNYPQQSAIMSTRSTRSSTKRSASAEGSKDDSKTSPAKAKKSKKENKKNIPKTDTSLGQSAIATDGPWYTVFTKGDEQYTEYMKNEWGFEKRGDEAMFEKLSLEGAQAGLSWLTILRKREAYRQTFHNFDIDKVASMTTNDVQAILDTPKTVDTRSVVVKHRGKIEAVIHNAKCIQKMRQEQADKTDSESQKNHHGVFDAFLWSFVDDKPIVNGYWDGKNLSDCPSTSLESDAMSKALRKLGFKFVGATTCYSMMQAYGMVVDHPVGSPEYKEALKRLEQRPGGYQMRQYKGKETD